MELSISGAKAALNNREILDQIIWFSHRGGCSKCLETVHRKIYRKRGMFNCNHGKDLQLCACVSKLWAEVAIPHIWEFHANCFALVKLWNLLGNERNIPEDRKDILDLSSSQMNRFRFYSTSVKRLSLQNHIMSSHTVSTLHDKIVSANQPLLLPNLATLLAGRDWFSDFGFSVLRRLLSPKVQHLELEFDIYKEGCASHINRCLEEFVQLTPNLKTLVLRGYWDIPHYRSETRLIPDLSQLPRFQHLELLSLPPGCTLTMDTIDVLKTIPNLSVFDLQTDTYRLNDYLNEIRCEAEMADSEENLKTPFENLKFLLFRGTQRLLKKLMDETTGSDLLVFSFVPTKAPNVCTNICSLLAQTYHNLDSIHLDYLKVKCVPFTAKDLHVLTGIKTLYALEIFGIRITNNNELSENLQVCPNLYKLCLVGGSTAIVLIEVEDKNARSDPDYESEWSGWHGDYTGLSIGLSALPIFQEKCPQLTYLGIDLIADSTFTHGTPPSQPFKTIKWIDLTGSFPNYRLEDFSREEAVKYIVSLLPRNGTLRFDIGGEYFRHMCELRSYKDYQNYCYKFQKTVHKRSRRRTQVDSVL